MQSLPLLLGDSGLNSVLGSLAALIVAVLGCGLLAELLLLAFALRELRQPTSRRPLYLIGALLLLLAHALICWSIFAAARASQGEVTLNQRLLCCSFFVPLFVVLLLALSRLRRYALPLALGLSALAVAPIGIYLLRWVDHPIATHGAAIQLAFGFDHACALTTSGEVACWGNNHEGQLGIGDRPLTRSRPAAVVGLREATSLVAGKLHTCVLRAGQVLCWGQNSAGQLGLLPRRNSLPVVLPGVDGAVEVLAWDEVLWVRTATGQLRGRGTVPRWGALRIDTSVPLDTAQVAVTERAFCTRLRGGEVACHGMTAGRVDVPGRFSLLVATREEVCGVRQDGVLLCWSPLELLLNQQRQREEHERRCALDLEIEAVRARALRRRPKALPCDHKGAQEEDGLRRIDGLAEIIHVAAGPKHLCAASRQGQVHCWGEGWRGQLGDGAESHGQPRPVALPGPAARLFAAEELSCAQLTDGRVLCWGNHPPGVEAGAMVKCHDTWLGGLWCVPRPAEVAVLRDLR